MTLRMSLSSEDASVCLLAAACWLVCAMVEGFARLRRCLSDRKTVLSVLCLSRLILGGLSRGRSLCSLSAGMGFCLLHGEDELLVDWDDDLLEVSGNWTAWNVDEEIDGILTVFAWLSAGMVGCMMGLLLWTVEVELACRLVRAVTTLSGHKYHVSSEKLVVQWGKFCSQILQRLHGHTDLLG